MSKSENEGAKLVVVTPVRNEGRILRTFLRSTTLWADEVVILDQASDDESLSICREFPKVHVFENPDRTYDEGWRQRFLIEKARELVPGRRVLIALDADEIPIEEDRFCGWDAIRHAPPGTSILFHKPDLLSPPSRCRHRRDWFALGFADDGRAHSGEVIHSRRIPGSGGGAELRCEGLQVLHLARTRRECFLHRSYCYSMIERIRRTKSLRHRWLYYAPSLDWPGRIADDEPTPTFWLQALKELNLDIDQLACEPINPWTLEALELMARHGESTFWWEDIWRLDWEAARIEARHRQTTSRVPLIPIAGPPAWVRCLSCFARYVLRYAYGINSKQG